MESAVLGLVLDSSVLIAAERRNLTAAQAIENVQKTIGEAPVVLSAVTIAEIGHGIYRTNMPEIRERRRAFLDDLKAAVPIYPVTEATAEIIARIGGEQAAKGINIALDPWPEPDLPLDADTSSHSRGATRTGLQALPGQPEGWRAGLEPDGSRARIGQTRPQIVQAVCLAIPDRITVSDILLRAKRKNMKGDGPDG